MRFAICFYTLFALLAAPSFSEEKRIEPGSRQLSEEELKIHESFQKKETSEKNELRVLEYYPPVVYDTDIHNFSAISVLGDYVVLEDGSGWKIRPGYESEAFSWKEFDPIVITENDSVVSSWFHGYNFKMTNLNTNKYIETKLFLGPLLDNPNTLQVVSIDPYYKEVGLSDNSFWKVDSSDFYLLDKWLIGDGIIIGRNYRKRWHSTSDKILINVNLLKTVKCHRVQ